MKMSPSAIAPITGSDQSTPPEIGVVRPVTTTVGATGLASGVSWTRAPSWLSTLGAGSKKPTTVVFEVTCG